MRVPSTDGVDLELHDFGGTGAPLLIAHATGFCAGAYLPLVPLLAERHHVWGVDFRAHGSSTSPASGDLSWHGMVDDVLGVVEAIDAGPVLGFGHSMGGAALAGAELRRPGTLRAAYLFEPIIVPAGWVGAAGSNPMADAARRRRPDFASRAEALARYAGRPPLGTLRADALWAYVEHGFVDQPSGGVTLACTPEDEARVFEATGKQTIASLDAVATPIVVACGDREADRGPAAFSPAVADALPNGSLQRYAHVGHFGPFQDPETVAADALAHFARN